jgi:hypothetical protein
MFGSDKDTIKRIDKGWDTEFEVVVPQAGAQVRHMLLKRILDQYTHGRTIDRDAIPGTPHKSHVEELYMLEAIVVAGTAVGFTNFRYNTLEWG